MQSLNGICPVLPTPFLSNCEIDFHSVRRIVSFAVEAGASALATLGVASECWKLTEEERAALVETVASSVNGVVPVVAGAGGESTHAAIHHARIAQNAGATVLMVMPPLHFRLAEQAIVDYYRAISEACDLPIMIQDTSAMGVNQMSAPLLERLAREVERVAYAKVETLPAGPKISALESCEGLTLFSGNGALNIFDALDRGVGGVMPGADLVDWFVRIWRSYQAGRFAEAAAAHRVILPLLTLECQSAEAFPAITKHLLYLRGLIAEPVVRPPAGYQVDEIAARQIAAWARELD